MLLQHPADVQVSTAKHGWARWCQGIRLAHHVLVHTLQSTSIEGPSGCRLRLTALFALRYEQKGSTAVTALLQRLQSLGIPQEMLDVVPALLRHCGASSRVGTLYSDRTLATRFATRARANLRVCCWQGAGGVHCSAGCMLLCGLPLALPHALAACKAKHHGRAMLRPATA